MDETELLINTRNGQRAEIPLGEAARESRVTASRLPDRDKEVREALARLQGRAETDPMLADLLTVMRGQ